MPNCFFEIQGIISETEIATDIDKCEDYDAKVSLNIQRATNRLKQSDARITATQALLQAEPHTEDRRTDVSGCQSLTSRIVMDFTRSGLHSSIFLMEQ